MRNEIEIKNGQPVGIIERNSITGEIQTKPGIIMDINLGIVDIGGFGKGIYRTFQLTLPGLENEIINAVRIEEIKSKKSKEQFQK